MVFRLFPALDKPATKFTSWDSMRQVSDLIESPFFLSFPLIFSPPPLNHAFSVHSWENRVLQPDKSPEVVKESFKSREIVSL